MADIEINYKNSTIVSINSSGTTTLNTAGTYCEDDIEIEYTRPSAPQPTLQSKTVSPSMSQQTVSPDSGYDGLSSVTVNAMPSGSATTPTTTITANPTISVSNSGLITASVSGSQSVTPTVSAGYVSSGISGTVTVGGSNTSQLTTQAAQTITPTTNDQTIASGKYLTGTQTIKGDANLLAANIKKDVVLFGVTGTLEGSGGTNWILLASDEFTVNTTSTSATTVGSIDISAYTSSWTDADILWIHTYDKAGARNGYFYGANHFFLIDNNGTRPSNGNPPGYYISYNNNAWNIKSGTYGIYPYNINSSWEVVINSKYSSSNTLTINGTFKCEVYKLSGLTIF